MVRRCRSNRSRRVGPLRWRGIRRSVGPGIGVLVQDLERVISLMRPRCFTRPAELVGAAWWPPTLLRRQLPGIQLHGEPVTGPLGVRPAEEVLVVIELDRATLLAANHPGLIGVVFDDRKPIHAHERMFAFI